MKGCIREVSKRDGRVVPFDRDKIADAIDRAFRAVGEGGPSLARELAAAVEHFLVTRLRQDDSPEFPQGLGAQEPAIPQIEDIQDVVETVLMEMGHSKAAKAYILYRQKRALLRQTLEVRREVPDRPDPREDPSVAGGADVPRVDEGNAGTSEWSKVKISAALIREADVDPSVAEEIAAAVETRVLGSGLRRISTALVRELVDNELFERGFDSKLERQAPVGLPRYDLEQIIFGDDTKAGYSYAKTPTEVRDIVASRIFRQYSLGEAYSPEVAAAHREGRLFIHRLDDPLRVDRAVWSVPRLDVRAEGEVESFFLKLRQIERFVGEGVRLRRLDRLLESVSATEDESSERGPSERGSARVMARQVLERLAEISAAVGHVRLRETLEFDLDGAAESWLRALLDLDVRRGSCFRVSLRFHRVFADAMKPGGSGDAAGSGLRSCIAELGRRGVDLEFLPAESSRWEDREGRDPAEELTVVVSKITLNLPRVALRAPRSFEAELDDVVALAVKGLLERRHFVTRLAARPEAPLWELFGEPESGSTVRRESLATNGEFVVGVVGLNECVRALTGRELHQDQAAQRRAREVLESIARRLSQESSRLGLRLVLEETANRGVVRRLEEADARLYAEREAEFSYTDGVRWHRHAPLDPLRRLEELVAFAPRVRLVDGIVDDVRQLVGSDGELLLSLLDESLPLLLPAAAAATPRV